MFSGHTTSDEMGEHARRRGRRLPDQAVQRGAARCPRAGLLRLKDAQDRVGDCSTGTWRPSTPSWRPGPANGGDAAVAAQRAGAGPGPLVEQRDGRRGRPPGAHAAVLPLPGRGGGPRPDVRHADRRQFIEMLECVAPLHDIGKVGAAGPHPAQGRASSTPEERMMHAGAHDHRGRACCEVGERTASPGVPADGRGHRPAPPRAVRRQGYPDRLAGDAIPLAARLVGVADVYDALRCRARLQAGIVPRCGGPDSLTGLARPVRPGTAGGVPPGRGEVRSHLPRDPGLSPRLPSKVARLPHDGHLGRRLKSLAFHD